MRHLIGALLVSVALGVSSLVSAAPLPLKRGVAIHEWLNWAPLAADGSYRWPPYRSVTDWLAGARPLSDWPPGDPFSAIKALGFDFVRLTVDPGPLLASTGARRQQAFAVLGAAVTQVTAAGLRVVVDLHGVSQVPAYGMDLVNGPAGSPALAGYRQMVAELAALLQRLGPDRVALEPFNEPAHYPCEGQGDGAWQAIMAAQVAAIRAVSAELTIVVTGACGGSITGLIDLDPGFDDPNLLYSFHMYEPHLFTHQRADDPEAFASGLPWPAAAGTPEAVIAALRAQMSVAGLSAAEQAQNLAAVLGLVERYFREDWGPAQLEARFAQALDWARDHAIPPERLFMGEFGAILMSPDGRMGAFNADRLRYITAVRRAAEAHGIAWSLWEYANPYGMSLIVPTGPAVPDGDLLRALGLGQ